MAKESKETATDMLAWLIIEANMPLPYEVGKKLSENSRLFKSLVKITNLKRRREAEQFARLFSHVYNASGGKTTMFDFIQKTEEDREREAQESLRNALSWNMLSGVPPTVSPPK